MYTGDCLWSCRVFPHCSSLFVLQLKLGDPTADCRYADNGQLKYQLQRTSPWRSVGFQWQTWLVLITAFVLLFLVPYVAHCMMTAFTDPPPPITFKVAAASYGLLTEILLIKCLATYLIGRYRQAEQSSFTVRARGSEEDRTSPGRWDRSEASAAAGHAPSEAKVDERTEGTTQLRF